MSDEIMQFKQESTEDSGDRVGIHNPNTLNDPILIDIFDNDGLLTSAGSDVNDNWATTNPSMPEDAQTDLQLSANAQAFADNFQLDEEMQSFFDSTHPDCQDAKFETDAEPDEDLQHLLQQINNATDGAVNAPEPTSSTHEQTSASDEQINDSTMDIDDPAMEVPVETTSTEHVEEHAEDQHAAAGRSKDDAEDSLFVPEERDSSAINGPASSDDVEHLTGDDHPQGPPVRPKTSSTRDKLKAARAGLASKFMIQDGSSRDHARRHRRSRSRAEDDLIQAANEYVERDEDFKATKEQFLRFQALFEQRKAQNLVATTEEIEFMKAEREFARREAKYKADKRVDEASDSEMQGSGPTFQARNSNRDTFRFGNHEDEDFAYLDDEHERDSDNPFAQDEDLDEPRPARKTQKRKDREVEEVMEDALDDMPIPKKGKTGKAGNGKKAPGPAKGSKKAGRASKASGKGNGSNAKKTAAKKQGGPTMLNMDSLTNSNILADAQGNSNLAAAPTFTETRKDLALKQMIASLPEDQMATAKIDFKFLAEATKEFTGRGSCKADGKGGWLVKGMRTSLFHYQTLGCSFMRSREGSTDGPRGGICADQMGLGKTVTMLANIVNGMPPRNVRVERRTTLIVAPPALLSQWSSEIEKHCKMKLSVLRYKSSNSRDASAGEVTTLEGVDIILTTYTEVLKSYPHAEPPVDCQTAEEKAFWWKKHFQMNRGTLHKAKFLRVVLDEAQAIKNYKSRTSLGCRALLATHRWALSGTPICNTVQELYPYFKFLQVPHTGSFRVFKKNFYGDNDPGKIARLHALLSRYMIRRTHADRLFGVPLLQLPEGGELIHWVKFNRLEANVYEIVKHRMRERIQNMIAKDPNALKRNYSNILVMMLRLRQMTCHILLVEHVMRDLLEREDIELLTELTKSETTEKAQEHCTKQMLGLRRILASDAAKIAYARTAPAPLDPSEAEETDGSQTVPAEETGAVGDNHVTAADTDLPTANTEDSASNQAEGSVRKLTDEALAYTGGKFGMVYDFRKYLKNLRESERWDEVNDHTLCSSCHGPAVDPQLTQCYHIYCKDCMETLEHEAAELELDKARCLKCNVEFAHVRPLNPEVQDSSSSDDGTSKRGKKKKSTAKNDDGVEEEAISSWIEMEGTVLPSAKTMGVKAQLMNWFEEDPTVKVIIYTQFVSMIKIMKRVCTTEKWGSCTYYGGMSMDAREKAISDFKTDPTCSIMIASLRCGGIGLNLTMASKVICIDPWWNNAIEQQAFGRVFRHGQTKETMFVRFVVKGTIDEHLMKMQARKDKEIGQVMDSKSEKLSLNELLKLFAPSEGLEDEHDTGFVMVEDKETRPMAHQDSEDEHGLDDE